MRYWTFFLGLRQFRYGIGIWANSSSKVNVGLLILGLNQLALPSVDRFLDFIQRVCIREFESLFDFWCIFGRQFNLFTTFEFNGLRHRWPFAIDERELVTGNRIIVLVDFDCDIFKIQDRFNSKPFFFDIIIIVHQRRKQVVLDIACNFEVLVTSRFVQVVVALYTFRSPYFVLSTTKWTRIVILVPIFLALPKHGLAYFLGMHLWFKHHHPMDEECIIRHSLK